MQGFENLTVSKHFYPEHRPILDDLNIDFTAPSAEKRFKQEREHRFINVSINKLSPLLDQVTTVERSAAVDEFILLTVALIGESWEVSGREGEEDLARLIQAAAIAKCIQEVIELGDPEEIGKTIQTLYSASKVPAYRRKQFLEVMIKFVTNRVKEMVDNGKLADEGLDELSEPCIREEALKYNLGITADNAAAVFDALAKTDTLYPAIREQINNAGKAATPQIALALAQIEALDDNKLHGIAASIIWEVKERSTRLLVESSYYEDIKQVMEDIALRITLERATPDLSPLALKFIIKAVYTLIEAGPDSVRSIPNTTDIQFESYSMKALNVFTALHPLDLDALMLNVRRFKREMELTHINPVNIGTLLKQKARTAQISASRDLAEGYSSILNVKDFEVSNAAQWLLTSIGYYLDQIYTEPSEEQLLEDVLEHMKTDYTFRRFSNTFATPLLKEVMKVVICDGRIFTEGAIPEGEELKYQPRLDSLEKAYTKVFSVEA